MPPVSQAQRAAMRSPKIRAKLGIPGSVAAEFNAADKGGKLPAHVKNGKPVRIAAEKSKKAKTSAKAVTKSVRM